MFASSAASLAILAKQCRAGPWDFYTQFSRSDGDLQGRHLLESMRSPIMNCARKAAEGTVTRYRGAPCVDINWYSPDFNNGVLTQEEQNFLYGQTRSRTIYEQTTMEAYMTGKLLPLPAGDIGAVFGLLYRRRFNRGPP